MFDLHFPSSMPASEPDYDPVATCSALPTPSFHSMPAGMKEALRRKVEGDVLRISDYEWLDYCTGDTDSYKSDIQSVYEGEEPTLP